MASPTIRSVKTEPCPKCGRCGHSEASHGTTGTRPCLEPIPPDRYFCPCDEFLPDAAKAA